MVNAAVEGRDADAGLPCGIPVSIRERDKLEHGIPVGDWDELLSRGACRYGEATLDVYAKSFQIHLEQVWFLLVGNRLQVKRLATPTLNESDRSGDACVANPLRLSARGDEEIAFPPALRG